MDSWKQLKLVPPDVPCRGKTEPRRFSQNEEGEKAVLRGNTQGDWLSQ